MEKRKECGRDPSCKWHYYSHSCTDDVDILLAEETAGIQPYDRCRCGHSACIIPGKDDIRLAEKSELCTSGDPY